MNEHVHHTMDRNIFNLNLSVEATSAYILVTAMLAENLRPSLDLIQARWTSTGDALDRALKELLARGVISRKNGPDGQALYYPNPSASWR